jgi:hypothetical protein
MVGKTERKIPPVKLKCRWEDNIKVDLNKLRYQALGEFF